jgi:hypothetical protein
MDPNLFYINYERTFEVLVTIVVISMIVERTLALLFESRPFIEKTEKKPSAIKEIISFVVGVTVCIFWKFDALTIILASGDKMTIPGMILTGGIIAGGTKGSVKLFKDWLGFMSSAEKERKELKEATLNKKIQAI